MKKIICIFLFINTSGLLAQETISIDTCSAWYNFEQDKFTGEKRFYSDLPNPHPASFSKFILGQKLDCYLSLNTVGLTLKVAGKGAVILLSNGQKINKPLQKIDVESKGDSNWKYSAFIKLNKTEIELLKRYTITDFRLYIYDGSLSSDQQLQFQKSLKCIISVK